ncbi:MAG TPA: putative bifunctional diguanylate cyclase/phosphodiesterase, partial [Candidatus Brocadiaceae bacterium]
ESQLMFMADRDPLTNLFNRRRFLEELEIWLAQAKRYQIQGALLFIDVDNFKYVNDTLGHQSGDLLLKTLADLLQKKLRNTDVLARMGGDEFAIILPYVDLDKAQLVARDILEVMRYRNTADRGKILVTTASIGIALFPEHGGSGETLLMCADLAMYTAKEGGRNRFCVYTPQQKTQIESRFIWKKRICDALKDDRFVLHLQPIIDLQQDSIAGYEALLRMIDEKGNLIPPADFLDSAERFGLICEIDRWVVKRAIHIIVELYHAGTSQFLEVNLSIKSILDPELLSIIKQELRTTGINPSNFVMEISESVFVENRDDIQHFITSFKTIGCRFAVDNFGTGLSTFIQHKQLLADYLKIDGSFIRDLPHSPADQHLVKAMVEVARGLGKKTVAMFVSNNETMRLLREFGVDYAQGYFIGQPKAI